MRVMKQMNNEAIALLKESMKDHPELADAAQLYLCQVCSQFELFTFLCYRLTYCGRRHTVFCPVRPCMRASVSAAPNIVNMISCRVFDTFS